MIARVGKHEVIHTQTLILPDGDDGWIEFDVGTWRARVKVRFESNNQEPVQQTLSIDAEGDHAILRLFNWRNSLGSATTKPVQFARMSGGASVSFMATHWYVGNVNRIDFQFLLETPS
jgi:hypothetical protein